MSFLPCLALALACVWKYVRVCSCVCVCVYTCVRCVHVNAHLCERPFVYENELVCGCVRVPLRVHACILLVCIRAGLCVCTCSRVHIGVGVCCARVHVCVCRQMRGLSVHRMCSWCPPPAPAFEVNARAHWANAGRGKYSSLVVRTSVWQTFMSGTARVKADLESLIIYQLAR